MTDFKIRYPEIKDPIAIETKSLEMILLEAKTYPKFMTFNPTQQKVIQRMIHSTTCFNEIIDNIYFTDSSVETIKRFLINGATIITDTNMIKTGINKTYTDKYNNKILCYVSEPEIHQKAKKQNTTRTVASITKALEETTDELKILACGNAPTFIYAAIEYIVMNNLDPEKICTLAMPVGFVNVIESKEYACEFLKHYKTNGIILNGRYGGSTLIVSCLHALYKLLED